MVPSFSFHCYSGERSNRFYSCAFTLQQTDLIKSFLVLLRPLLNSDTAAKTTGRNFRSGLKRAVLRCLFRPFAHFVLQRACDLYSRVKKTLTLKKLFVHAIKVRTGKKKFSRTHLQKQKHSSTGIFIPGSSCLPHAFFIVWSS